MTSASAPRNGGLKAWAKGIEADVLALWLAARDGRTPRYAKAVAGLVAAYALSPIDLIPDFIPVLGYLDDLILVPLGILLAIKLIPTELMTEYRAEAARRLDRPRSKVAALAIVAIWIAVAAFLIWLFWPAPADG